MLRVKLLRNLLILSIAIAILLPGYEYLFVHPAYHEVLIEQAEEEAVRFASHLVRALKLEQRLLTQDELPEDLERNLGPVTSDSSLVKLRIYSVRGEILFSTQAAEIGQVNEQDYFRNVVAAGRVYSKVVEKDHLTADGLVTQRDVVETYVPFIAGGAFGGAIEIYSDITVSIRKLLTLSRKTFATTQLMAALFLLAIFVALRRAATILQQRDRAEESLRLANEELEGRVSLRTEELSMANAQLTGQIAERALAEKALGKALEELRLDREKLAGILRAVPDGVLVTDGELNVLHMNPAAEKLLGRTLAEVVGQPLRRISEEVNFLRKVSQRLNGAAADQAFDFELPEEDAKSPRVYHARISPFLPMTHETPGIVLLISDVTREREIERMKSAFLGMAAHELNTPLTAIIGYSELLTAKETAHRFDAVQQHECLLLINDKAMALSRLIDDLLDISRIESGRPLSLELEQFDLAELVRESLAPHLEVSDKHRFELVLPEGVHSICADRERLGQIISHILANAIKYSPDGGSVRVALEEHEGAYLLVVADEGIGMSEEQLAHVFDRFYRVDSSNTAVQGAGLGLCIVRHVVLAHHGDVQIESRFGHGTVVKVTLPHSPPQTNS